MVGLLALAHERVRPRPAAQISLSRSAGLWSPVSTAGAITMAEGGGSHCGREWETWAPLPRNRWFARLSAGGRWIRTFSTAARESPRYPRHPGRIAAPTV